MTDRQESRPNEGASENGVVLYSSRRAWVMAIAGSMALIGGPIAVGVSRPLGAPGIGALAVGVVATLALLFDQPMRSIIRPAGIERRCPLSSRLIEWHDIESLDRLRRSGGVVAKVGRRRVVLCDRMEGHFENLELVRIVEDHAPNVIVRLEAPSIDNRPTDIYRRRSF